MLQSWSVNVKFNWNCKAPKCRGQHATSPHVQTQPVQLQKRNHLAAFFFRLALVGFHRLTVLLLFVIVLLGVPANLKFPIFKMIDIFSAKISNALIKEKLITICPDFQLRRSCLAAPWVKTRACRSLIVIRCYCAYRKSRASARKHHPWCISLPACTTWVWFSCKFGKLWSINLPYRTCSAKIFWNQETTRWKSSPPLPSPKHHWPNHIACPSSQSRLRGLWRTLHWRMFGKARHEAVKWRTVVFVLFFQNKKNWRFDILKQPFSVG